MSSRYDILNKAIAEHCGLAKSGATKLPDGSGFFTATVGKGEGNPEKETIARWQSSNGHHWVELYHHGKGQYSYKGGDQSGGSGNYPSHEHAINHMQVKVDSGYFLPDSAKRPMERVKKSDPTQAGGLGDIHEGVLNDLNEKHGMGDDLYEMRDHLRSKGYDAKVGTSRGDYGDMPSAPALQVRGHGNFMHVPDEGGYINAGGDTWPAQKSDPTQMGGLGDMKMDEEHRRGPGAQPGAMAMAEGDPDGAPGAMQPGHEAYHAYNKEYIDSDASDPSDPEFAPHAGDDSDFGFKRRVPVKLTPEQDADLLGHLHAVGHHDARAYAAPPEGSTPDDVARHQRVQAHHFSTSQRHFDEYRRKFKEYSGQPVSGYSPGSWDMLGEGHEGGQVGEAHPRDEALGARGSMAKYATGEGHMEAAAHHMRHRDENARHGTTWSGPAAKMHDILFREHAKAAGEDPDNPSAVLRSKAAQVDFRGGPNYPGHVVFHRLDEVSRG